MIMKVCNKRISCPPGMPDFAVCPISRYARFRGIAARPHRGRPAGGGCAAPRRTRSLGFVSTRVIPCVGAIIKDDAGRLLLINRGHQPGQGLWSVPGARVQAGETDEEALVREVREETGLVVTTGPLVGSVRRPAGGASQLDIRD